jgi:hypothetical protein
MEITTLAVGFPFRYYQHSPVWFMDWPLNAVVAVALIAVTAWVLSRAMEGKMTQRQLILLLLMACFTLGYIILNSILIVTPVEV